MSIKQKKEMIKELVEDTDNEKVEVEVKESPPSIVTAGYNPIYDKILFKKEAFSEMDEKLAKFVSLHEIGHRESYNYVMMSIIVPYILAFCWAAPQVFLLYITDYPILVQSFFSFPFLFSTYAVYLISMTYMRRKSEIIADKNAMKYLSYREKKDYVEEYRCGNSRFSLGEKSRLGEFLNTHPSKSTTLNKLKDEISEKQRCS